MLPAVVEQPVLGGQGDVLSHVHRPCAPQRGLMQRGSWSSWLPFLDARAAAFPEVVTDT